MTFKPVFIQVGFKNDLKNTVLKRENCKNAYSVEWRERKISVAILKKALCVDPPIFYEAHNKINDKFILTIIPSERRGSII